jgi:hypothetical protein
MMTDSKSVAFSNGDTYKGEWKNNNCNGFGILSFRFRGIYEGQFVNGLREGAGIMRYNDGNVFQGEWKKDRKISGLWTNYVDDESDDECSCSGDSYCTACDSDDDSIPDLIVDESESEYEYESKCDDNYNPHYNNSIVNIR